MIRYTKRYQFVLVGIIIPLLVYIFDVLYSVKSSTIYNELAERQIETLPKLILNGYLGIFFYFKTLGNLNWLILPILIYISFHFSKLKIYEKFTFLFYCGAFIVISIKGYGNYRYGFTLLPLTLLIVFFSIFKQLENDKPLLHKFYVIALGMLLFNYLYFYKFKSVLSELRNPSTEQVTGTENLQVIDKKVQVELNISDKIKKETAYQKLVKTSFPNNLINYINADRNDKEASFLVDELPLFYYYGNKKGYTYAGYADVLILQQGKRPLFGNGTDVKVFLRDSLNCQYILTSTEKLSIAPLLENFVKQNCFLVLNESDLLLFKIKN